MDPHENQYDRLVVALADLKERAEEIMAAAQTARERSTVTRSVSRDVRGQRVAANGSAQHLTDNVLPWRNGSA